VQSSFPWPLPPPSPRVRPSLFAPDAFEERGDATPLSSVGSLPRAVPHLLEGLPGRHSSGREANMFLPPGVGLSLSVLRWTEMMTWTG
jgi:hypothetical protein